MQIVEFLEELNKLNEESIKTKVANIEFERIDGYEQGYEDDVDFNFDEFVFTIKVYNTKKNDSTVIFLVSVGVDKSEIKVYYSNVGATYVPYGEGSTLWDSGDEISDADASEAPIIDDFIYKNENNERLTKEQAYITLGCSEKEFDIVENKIWDYVWETSVSAIEYDIEYYI